MSNPGGGATGISSHIGSREIIRYLRRRKLCAA